jgi:hypothetical protein
MPLTGRLGTIDSRPSDILLGADVVSSLTQSISDSIAFVQTVNASTKQFSLSDTISFVHTAIGVRDVFASPSSTLSFSDVVGATQPQSASSTISFVDSATEVRILVRSVSDPISFTQDTTENIKNASASSTLNFVQSVDEQGPIYIAVAHFIPFADTPSEDQAVINELMASVIFFKDTAGRVLTASVSQSISFAQDGHRATGGKDTLAFVQTVTVGKAGFPADTVFFTDTAHANAFFTRSLTTPLTLVQGLTFILEAGCTLKLYSPFVGTGDPGYTSPSTVSPTLGDATLTLTYPYGAPTRTLTLRNPAFGDRNQLSFARVNRTSRGGTLIVFADPSWPKIEKLLLTASGLKQQQIDDYQAFLVDSLGKEIGLLDHENRQWRGIITNPDAEIVENGRNNRTVSFEFEGSLV